MEVVTFFLAVIERLISCISVVKSLLSNKTKKWIVKKAIYIWGRIPVWIQRLRQQYTDHFSLMNEHNPPNQRIERGFNFFTLGVFAFIAANMYMTSVVFVGLAIYVLLKGSLFAAIAGGLLAVFFRKIAVFYRADAYNIAIRYGINIFPWRTL